MKLTKSQQVKIKQIAKKYRLKFIVLFGSQANQRVHQKSDIDIAVLPLKFKDFEMKTYSSLLFDFEKVFFNIDGEIDIVFIPIADPLLLYNISQSSQLLFGDKTEFAEFKIYAFKSFQDYQPYFKLEEKEVHQFIKELKPT